jgi:endonuclease/exonuclease/phosphatase (EEP) superfamily protein YafD
MIRSGFLGICFAAALALSTAGFLAPLYPALEIANHFRPFALVLSLMLLPFALKMGVLPRAALLLAAMNAALMSLPVASTARAVASTDAGTIKVVTFNVWVHNQHLDQVADFLAAEAVDVVLLQEVTAGHRAALLPRLQEAYPHVLTCDCRNQVLLSRRPWIETGSNPASASAPGLVWARFADPRGGTYRVVGLHAAYPLRPGDQAEHYAWLTETFSQEQADPVILAGDFNLTPWSYKLALFAHGTGLVRHSTFLRSWPSEGRLPVPVFPIDHVFSSPGIRTIAMATGPKLGSDHLPVIATLQMR